VPFDEPDERTAAEAIELPANATVEASITALVAIALHQENLRTINTLPIAQRTRERASEAASIT
jgi:hypothetical protein